MPDKLLGVVKQFTPKYGKGKTSSNFCLAEVTESTLRKNSWVPDHQEICSSWPGCTTFIIGGCRDSYRAGSCPAMEASLQEFL